VAAGPRPFFVRMPAPLFSPGAPGLYAGAAMRPDTTIFRHGAIRALWLTLLALLLVNGAGLPRPVALQSGESGIVRAVAAPPVAAQFHDPGAVYKVAASRFPGFRAHDLPGGDPPLPSHGAPTPAPALQPAPAIYPSTVTADVPARGASGLHARAPPLRTA
jgi:hypothetical protein